MGSLCRHSLGDACRSGEVQGQEIAQDQAVYTLCAVAGAENKSSTEESVDGNRKRLSHQRASSGLILNFEKGSIRKPTMECLVIVVV